MQSFNVIAMAILLTLVVIKGADIVAETAIHPKMLEKNVYVVEGVTQKSTKNEPEGPKFDPIEPLLASASVEKGMKVAQQCLQCHVLKKDGGRGGKLGPNLWNVVGRPIADQKDMDYSNALLSKASQTWTYENLNHFLWKPRDFVHGTKMSFAGLKKTEQRAEVIAYLRTLSDTPVPLPKP